MEYFMDFQTDLEKAKVVILPIPHEETTSYGKGTKEGPKAILEASKELENYDLETNSEPYLNGIYTENYTDINKIKEYTNKFIIALGGEHSITPYLLKKLNQDNLSILQIDAHADLKDEFEGRKDSHACAARRIHEINPNIVQVGVRSLDKEEKKFIEKNNIKTFFMKNINNIQDIISNLKENVYITIDLDGFDPSVIPAVGNPEPGGLSWYQCLNILKEVFKNKNVIGMDVNELSPKENDLISPYITAKLIYHCIGYKFKE
jgi:agmatinase